MECIERPLYVHFIYFSLSPNHLETRSELLTEKKVDCPASVATAFAMKLLPVPGGPKRRIPRHGLRLPAMFITLLFVLALLL